MKEEEAKTKECPLNSIHSRIVGGMMAKEGVPEQILSDCLDKSKCIASKCMMWAKDLNRGQGGHCGLAK